MKRMREIRKAHARFRAALKYIAKCNKGFGHMPEIAQRALNAGS